MKEEKRNKKFLKDDENMFQIIVDREKKVKGKICN